MRTKFSVFKVISRSRDKKLNSVLGGNQGFEVVETLKSSRRLMFQKGLFGCSVTLVCEQYRIHWESIH